MQQRASICRALIHEPKMLLLDEPFGALDAFTREELWCILRDLWTEQRFNVILVTHDLREVGVPRRHGLRDEQAARAASSSSARSTCRARASSRSPTPRSSPTSCTSCASHIGAIRKPGRRQVARDDARARLERWSPWLLLVAVIAAVAGHLLAPSTSRSSSSRARCGSRSQLVEFTRPDRRPRLAHLLGHDGRASASRSWSACCSAS